MLFEGGEERSSMSAQRRQFVQLRRSHSPFHLSRLACPQMSLRRSYARLDAFGAGMVWGMRQAGASMASAGGRPTNRIHVCTNRPTNCPTNRGTVPTNPTNCIEGVLN